jgi:NAD(P)-dependent dehydrogenase (short-subunit alcohol dehydrogenase family)
MSKVVVITGASTGFGYDSAAALAERGHRVFATMRDLSSRNAAHLKVVELDVTSDESVDRAIGRVLEDAGQIDVVINNAGCAGLGVTEGYLPAQFQQMFDVNVVGAQRVNRAVLPSMRGRRSGLLIHVSSGAGRVVVPTMAAYCASKFALEALADAYRYELHPFGIDSVLVEPGIYKTPIFDRLVVAGDRERVAAYAGEDFAERVYGVFTAIIGAPDNPGTSEVVSALVRLVEMQAGERPFRTVVSAPIQALLDSYNAAHEALRPTVAQIFNVPELAAPPAAAATGA